MLQTLISRFEIYAMHVLEKYPPKRLSVYWQKLQNCFQNCPEIIRDKSVQKKMSINIFQKICKIAPKIRKNVKTYIILPWNSTIQFQFNKNNNGWCHHIFFILFFSQERFRTKWNKTVARYDRQTSSVNCCLAPIETWRLRSKNPEKSQNVEN